jgi:mannose-6-phosphate isomerase
MGVHGGGPSRIRDGGQELGELIAGDTARYLGKAAAERFGGLPFLFKLLAAEKPLSIQAHPNLRQAEEGFRREDEAGIARDAPGRNYRDPNHKPEIVCALSPFTAMCGFREPEETGRIFERVFDAAPERLSRGLKPLEEALGALPEEKALSSFLAVLFGLSPETRGDLASYLSRARTGNPEYAAESEWAAKFAELYPGDPSVIAPFYLNIVTLKPGEAVFLPAGVLHSYIRGFAVELMANSDNVLRGGLSSKHIDVPELMRVLDFSPYRPEILRADPEGFYAAPCGEFSLCVLDSSGAPRTYGPAGASILVVVRGAAKAGAGDSGEVLARGMSAFVPAGMTLSLSGDYTVYIASIPDPPKGADAPRGA